MNFGQAIELMKQGERVARSGWNGKGMWLALQSPDEHSKMRRPYIFLSDAQGLLVPWLASQTDMLADDWAPAEHERMRRIELGDVVRLRTGGPLMTVEAFVNRDKDCATDSCAPAALNSSAAIASKREQSQDVMCVWFTKLDGDGGGKESPYGYWGGPHRWSFDIGSLELMGKA